jgi:hypothetical protein
MPEQAELQGFDTDFAAGAIMSVVLVTTLWSCPWTTSPSTDATPGWCSRSNSSE